MRIKHGGQGKKSLNECLTTIAAAYKRVTSNNIPLIKFANSELEATSVPEADVRQLVQSYGFTSNSTALDTALTKILDPFKQNMARPVLVVVIIDSQV